MKALAIKALVRSGQRTAVGDVMAVPDALTALAALGQPTRLDIFRLLMRHGAEGLLAGAIAETIGCPHNTLSSHLGILTRAGLIRRTRQGRTIVYRADVESMRALLGFLVTDCCEGHPELCDFRDKGGRKCASTDLPGRQT